MKLYESFTIKELTIPNRVVVPPMSHGGPGLIIMEATAVEPSGRITIHDLGLWNEEQMKSHRKVNDWIHECTPTKTGIQLAHAGRKGVVTSFMTPVADHRGLGREFGALSVSSSNKPFSAEFTPPHALTMEECEAIKGKFVDAARFAVEAGYDLIEIHAAHGYLLNQFSSPLVNDRTDKYGGSREARFAYPLEVIAAVKSVIPPTMPLVVRISGTDWCEGGITIDDSIEYSKAMKALGVDMIHVSSGGVVAKQQIHLGWHFQIPLSRDIRKHAEIPTIAVGGITDAADANNVLEGGEADLVAVGRAILKNPYWTRMEAEKHEVAQWFPAYQGLAYFKRSKGKDLVNQKLAQLKEQESGESQVAV